MQRKISITDTESLADAIAGLSQERAAELKNQWHLLFGNEPPRRISRDLLLRAVAYRIQENTMGGLKPSTRRLLARVAADAASRRPIAVTAQPTLRPGTVLLREWHGTEHQVVVRKDGVVFQGKTYKSLSEVARRITGTNCSGPRFFGLKQRRPEHAHGTV